MHFQHSGEIWRDFPALVPGVIYADGITPDVEVGARAEPFLAVARSRLAQMPEGELPEIQAWRRAFSQMGLKPTQYRCASESLLRRFRKEGTIPRLHPLVDLCNAVSLAFATPVAVLDVSRISGDLEVRYAAGDEDYLTFSGDVEHPGVREVIFADEAGQAHARRWTNRQSGLSAVRKETTATLIVAEALHPSAAAGMTELTAAIGGELAEVWSADPAVAMLTKAAPRFTFGPLFQAEHPGGVVVQQRAQDVVRQAEVAKLGGAPFGRNERKPSFCKDPNPAVGFRVMRVLPAIRLSLTTDATTSPERQFESIKKFADYKDHELVPITEADYDLDVSGAVSPFDRPGLGRWLRDDRLDQWDAICAAKLDRISRSLFDFTAFVHWLEAHGKALIILDPELDLTTKEGRAMANVLMTFAEYEREVIGARVKDAYDKLLREGKYTGGMVFFGYRPVKLTKSWGYEIDPEYGPLVQEIADRYLRYESIGSIVRWLNDSGVPCPKDVIRKRNGKPLKGSPWTTGTIRHILKSPAVLGAITNSKDEPLRDEQGMVIYRAAPLLADDPGEARDKFERIQARLAATPVPVRVNTSILGGVAFCGECGGGMYVNVSNVTKKGKLYSYAYYRCEYGRMRDGRCNSAYNFRGEPLEDAVSSTLLELAGDRKLRTERLVPGRDYSEESARLIEQTQHLQAEIGRARLARKDYSELQATLDAANAELDRLADLDPEPARLEYDDTDQTFREWWELNDQAAHNAFLRELGIRVVVRRDRLPSIEHQEGPLTALDITRMAIIERPGMYAVIYLGNLGDLLRRASDLAITIKEPATVPAS